MDLVLLQEVTRPFLRRLLADARVRGGFLVTDSGNAATFHAGYGTCMLIRRGLPVPSVAWVKFTSGMGRRGLVAKWSAAGFAGKLAVATVHLESLDNRALRLDQMEALAGELARVSDASVVAGDFNVASCGPYRCDAEDAELAALGRRYGYVDACAELGLTYDARAGKTFWLGSKDTDI